MGAPENRGEIKAGGFARTVGTSFTGPIKLRTREATPAAIREARAKRRRGGSKRLGNKGGGSKGHWHKGRHSMI